MPTDHRAALANIKTFPQLIAYLRDEMGWPIARDSFEDVDDLFYDFTADELGIDPKTAAKITEIKRLRPLSTHQPWGIFFVKFEPKKLPVVALRRILSQVALKKRASANSADRTAWAADDLLFVSNYGEGSERQISFAHFAKPQDGHDLPTLKVLGWDNRDTALHLDAVAKELTEQLSWPKNESDVEAWRKGWRGAFTLRHGEVVTTSKELSIRLAKLAGDIRDRIKSALAIETDRGPLTKLMKAFQTSLVHDLDADGFADMYAQTIAYGLLSARIADPHKKTVDDFAGHMRTNPFLRELMETFLKVGGRRGKAGGPGIDFDELGVSEVVQLLDDANMEAVVLDFGDKNPQEDPVIHFYELFLKEYDAKKRMQRGVFYTPRPVVSYIVRSVDELLRTEFGLEDGLADTTTWGEMAKRHRDLKIPEGTSPDQAFVQILDPATGTGTFLVEVIDIIHKTMTAKWKATGHGDKNVAALWNEYVPKHLLKRLHAYELLMAPYAIAHLKVGLKLYETGYRFGSDERARIYLTNALEPAHDFSGTFEFAIPALAHEAEAVNKIKREQRFTVVIGNPPYSDSVTENPWMMSQLREFKEGLDEQKSDLNREEWKFLRVARELAGASTPHICGFIINNAFLRAITHRLMRKYLLTQYSRIDVLNLHGSSRPPESVPLAAQQTLGIDGADKNVFEIMQGVAIVLMATAPALAGLRYGDEWGSSERKLDRLTARMPGGAELQEMSPSTPFFFLVERDALLDKEYGSWRSIGELLVTSTSGIQTGRDAFASALTDEEMVERIGAIRSGAKWNVVAPEVKLPEWSGFSLEILQADPQLEKAVTKWLALPFDVRPLLMHSSSVKRTRMPIMSAMLSKRIGICTVRQVFAGSWQHIFVSRVPISDTCISNKSREYPYVFPTGAVADSLAMDELQQLGSAARTFVVEVLGAEGKGSADEFVSYLYAVLHSPSFRSKYREQLIIDFPRVPLTSNPLLAHRLAGLGGELVALHLMESSRLDHFITTYAGPKNPEVGRVGWSDDTVWLDAAATKKGQPATPGTIGFRGVPEAVWNFHIGGYQVCEKWLKDRKGRTLSKDDIAHYQKIVVALNETIRLMQEIDEVIEKYGGWPRAFQTGVLSR